MPNSDAGPRAPLVIVGDLQSRRVPLLIEAARQHGFAPQIIPYDEFQNGAELPESIGSNVLVRLESPGEHPETMRQILRSGIAPMQDLHRVPIDESAISQLSFGRGEIVHPLQWFLGFEQMLSQIGRRLNSRGVRWMNTPESVVTAFDKQACLDRWNDAEIPTPRRYTGIKTYSQLRARIPAPHARVFIKLRYGFSAMGAVALEWRGDLVRAITTVDVAWTAGRPRLFVTKRPRIIHREFEVAWLIDTLAMEGIIVEDWLPKARWRGKSFDLRIVTIRGQAHHVVGRASSSPFTNLNLDSERIASDDVASLLGHTWPQTLWLAERAASHISNGYLGMDVLVHPCRTRSVVLEANAFGDYLPGLLLNGETTYGTEMRLFSACGAYR